MSKWLAAGYGAVAILLIEVMAMSAYLAIYEPTSLCIEKRGRR